MEQEYPHYIRDTRFDGSPMSYNEVMNSPAHTLQDLLVERPHEPLSLLYPSPNAVMAERNEVGVPVYSIRQPRYWTHWLAYHVSRFWAAPLLTDRDLACAFGTQKLDAAREYLRSYDFGPITGPSPELTSFRLELCERYENPAVNPNCPNPMSFQFLPSHCELLCKVEAKDSPSGQVSTTIVFHLNLSCIITNLF